MGTHPIFESDFDCLTEVVIGRHASRTFAENSSFGDSIQYEGAKAR